jgi:hypothetical protein
MFADYLVRGRYHSIPKHPEILGPDNLLPLTEPSATEENAATTGIAADSSSSLGSSAGVIVPGAVPGSTAATLTAGGADPGPKGIGAANE